MLRGFWVVPAAAAVMMLASEATAQRRLPQPPPVTVPVQVSPGTQVPTGTSQAGQLTFRSGIDLVTVSAVVKDGHGKLVAGLTRADFSLLDAGRARNIIEFRTDAAPISIALLVDGSGSMQVADKVANARQVANRLIAYLDPERDEVALFSFDTGLQQLRGFGRGGREELQGLLERVRPWGMTSLYDAIAETARRISIQGRARGHAAVLVLTDGMDTASALTPAEVSGIASAIDVPVYVVAVTSPLDHAGTDGAVTGAKAVWDSAELANLARWTGGDALVSSRADHTEAAVRQVVSELRHQYLIAFEPDVRPGWHPLELRVRNRHLSVRARGGYFSGQPQTGGTSVEAAK